MNRTIAIALALPMLLLTRPIASQELAAPAEPPVSPPSEAVVRFLAFGDSGKGTREQQLVGQAMAQVCRQRGCDLALMLGDNIYPSGVSSPADPQFITKFEQPYASLQLPVYVTLGNHDNGGGTGKNNRAGQAEVDYSSYAGRASQMWHMPARYYSVTAPIANGAPLVEFFCLDSNPLTARDPDAAWSAENYGQLQAEWFGRQLKASAVPWKIAFAHHPYLSNGAINNAGNYGSGSNSGVYNSGRHWKAFLDQTLCKAPVDLLLTGHDHTLQWLQPAAGCGQTQFIVSGAAAYPARLQDPQRNPAYWQSGSALGFFWIELRSDRMTVAAYTVPSSPAPRTRRKGRQPDLIPAFEQTAPKPWR